VIVLLSAVCISNWELLLELSYGYFYLFAASLSIGGWWIGQRLRSRSVDHESPQTRFSFLRIGLPIVCLACLLSLWLRHRWVASFHDDDWPRSFPYPDEIMMIFHDWLDSKYPAPPESFKIHGEFYTVWRYLNLTALALCAFAGVILGLACSTTGPVGITFWHDRIASVYRKPT
jgi:hypothetical protein